MAGDVIRDDIVLLIKIRAFEEMLLQMFSDGAVHGTTHTCIGQEYIPVALRSLIHKDDFVFSNHRSHGHYLALFDDAEGLLCEILGKEGAICNGVGGSQHLHRKGFLSTGVQGENVMVATGVAFHRKRKGIKSLAIAFIGDGTWGEGSVYESLNFASLHKLPLVVLVENNGIAQSTSTTSAMAGSVEDRAKAFDVEFIRISVKDIGLIRAALREPLAKARESCTPLIVEFITQRIGPHSKGDDSRTEDEIDAAKMSDWYPTYQRKYRDLFDEIESEITDSIKKLAADVRGRASSAWEVQ